MSDAKRTVEHGILMGLSERAHLTRATTEQAHWQVPDILNAIFDPCVRWAVEKYLEELKGEEDGQ